MKVKGNEHKQLVHGCYRTEIAVNPTNWHTQKASLTKGKKSVEWYVWYRFFDPAHKEIYPFGKPVKRRGMNKYTDLASRQAATQAILEMEKELIDIKHFNPITEKYMTVQDEEQYELLVDPKTPFIEALEKGLQLKEMDAESKKDIKNKLPHVKKAAEALKLNGKTLAAMPIKDIRRAHMRMLLNKIGKHKGDKWTANNFNRYRTDLRIIFDELNEQEAMDVNPMDGIKKRKAAKLPRKILTQEKFDKISTHLKSNYYTFWRFMKIFQYTGARETELLRVELSHVDINNLLFRVEIRKGEDYRWVEKPIEEEILPLWQELLSEAIKLDPQTDLKLYIFSEDLRPLYTRKPIRQEQISRRWYNHVKCNEELGVTEDFYSIKHFRTTKDINDEVAKVVKEAQKMVDDAIVEAQRKAAEKNSHTTTAMVRKVYDVNAEDRKASIIRQLQDKSA